MTITNERYHQLFKEIDQAPDAGIIYLSLRTEKIILQKYRNLQEVTAILMSKEEDGLLELHLFNDKKEYRWLRSVKSPDGLEHVVPKSKDVNSDSGERETFVENVYVEERFAKEDIKIVGIVNYLDFDEDDLLRITDYRLMEVT